MKLYHLLNLSLILLSSISNINSSILTPESGSVSLIVQNHSKQLVRRHGDHSHGDDDHDHEHEHEHEHGHEHGHEHEHEHVNTEQALSDQCGKLNKPKEYNLELHIISAVVLIVVSFIGCGATSMTKYQSFFKVPEILIDFGRYFGSGVILSTGFIHMLMSSIYNLSHKCSPSIFKEYTAFPTLIAMVAALALHLLEYMILSHFNKSKKDDNGDVKNDLFNNNEHGCELHCVTSLENKLTTYILELGILSHSIFIGISLGVTSGKGLIPLFIAILFHQFFEGIGLGARISEIKFPSIFKPLMMVLSFSITTSIGVVIGILIHSSYSPSSPVALVVQGVFDGISAGILIYTGLVELISKDISTKSDFYLKSKSRKVLCFIALYLGVIAMAIIGIWA